MDNDKLLRFNDPHITGGDAVVTITQKKAVDFVHTMYPEMDEFAALDFFIVNHYAWYVEDEKKCSKCKKNQ